MSGIQGKNTKPELIIRKGLHALGFRYRTHDKRLPGKPDLVFARYHAVIFVHGCFWHGHKNCKDFRIPKTRSEWWREKLEGNVARDRKKQAELRKLGWKIKVIWACQLKSENKKQKLGTKLPFSVFKNFGTSNKNES